MSDKKMSTKNPKGLLLAFLGVYSIMISQPIFTVMADSATFFVAHFLKPFHIISFAFFFSLLIPIVIMAILFFCAKINEKLGIIATLLTMALAFLLGALYYIKIIYSGSVGLDITIAVIVAVLLTSFIYLAVSSRSIIGLVGIGAIAFPAVFLLSSGINEIVKPQESLDLSLLSAKNVEATNPVIVVLFDELTPLGFLDENLALDGQRFPNFTEFSNDATWFRNAVAPHVATTHAVPAILSSKFVPPTDRKSPTYVNFPKNIFTLLGSSYDVRAQESFTSLCPQQICKNNAARKFELGPFVSDVFVIIKHVFYPKQYAEEKLPALDKNWRDFNGDPNPFLKKLNINEISDKTEITLLQQRSRATTTDRVEKFRSFYKSINASEKSFHFSHTLLPHTPYIYFPDGRKYNERQTGSIWASQPEADHAYHRYLMQLGTVDMLLGEMVAHLKNIGIYDQSLIIVTADHGVNFGRLGVHKRAIVEGESIAAHVPIFVKKPGQTTGEIREEFVSTIDLLPTVADVLGADVPFDVAGQSLFSDSKDRTQSITIHHQGSFLVDIDTLTVKNSVKDRILKFGQNTPLEDLSISADTKKNYIGKTQADFKISKSKPVAVRLYPNELKGQLENVDTNILIPANFAGKFRNPKKKAQHKANDYFDIVIEVNGVFVGVTRSNTDPKSKVRQGFKIIVPPRYFKNGKNDVTFFIIDDINKDKPELLRMRVID